VTAAVDRLVVARLAMCKLLSGSAVLSAEITVRFDTVFGLIVEMLLRMQTAYELAVARTEGGDFGNEYHVTLILNPIGRPC